MNSKLRSELLPLIETMRRLQTERQALQQEFTVFDPTNPAIASCLAQYGEALLATYELLMADYMAMMRGLGVEFQFQVSGGTWLNYEYSTDPVESLRNLFTITVPAITQKDSAIPLSHEESLPVVRRLARRLNARLAEESVPLFVFVELR